MKALMFVVVCAVLAAAAGASALPFENSTVIGHVPDRVVVTFRPGVTIDPAKAAGAATGQPAVDALLQDFSVHGAEALYADMVPGLERRIAKARMQGKSLGDADLGALERTIAFDFPAAMGLERVLAAFAALPEVQEVRPVDICRTYAYLPDDPGVNGSQWYLRNMTLGGADVRAVGGWNQALGDSNVIVAVIDSGVDWRHPDLGGPHPDKVNGSIWTNWDEYYGTPGVDDDHNGKVDDIRGWDFVNVPGAGWPDEDTAVADNDPSDYESHGTNCAGIVAAITNNGLGIAGVAPGCKVMAVRAGYLPDGSSQGIIRLDFAAQAMLYAAANGASIINASWGSTSLLASAVASCQAAGVLIVTAAGNDNTDSDPINGVPSYLSTALGVMCAAATASDDTKASFSNFGYWVEISAPGVSMFTTAYDAGTQSSTYDTVDGTSFASPLTAGAAALVWSAYPSLNYIELAALLQNTADDIDDLNPNYVGQLGAGRVNLLRALGDNLHRYPDEFPTMYDAFNCSAPGDTIGLPGGYVMSQTLVVPNRGVKLMGGYAPDYASRDPLGDPTVLQGLASDSVLRFQTGTGADTEVDGFRIQGGGGQSFAGIPYFGQYGGGIMLNATSPTLRNLHVTGNSTGAASTLGCGGGIALNNSNAVLENVLVEGNTSILGGGVFVYRGAPTFIGCTIRDNTLLTNNLSNPPKGGGLHALDADVTLQDCVISGHRSLAEGGGIYSAASTGTPHLTMLGGSVVDNQATGNGCGILHSGGTIALDRVEVSANVRSPAAVFSFGGGLYLANATADLDSLTVTGNDAHGGGGVAFSGCPTATLTNSLLTGNNAAFFGGGVHAQSCADLALEGNTVAGNLAGATGAAGLYLSGSTVALARNIIAANDGGATYANGVALISGAATFACNDVYGNTGANFSGVTDPTGTGGNISADPLFCAADNFNLGSTSPCLPANSGGCGLIGALNGGCGPSDVPADDGAVPTAFRVDQAFPNPFNPRTTIRFALPAAARTEVAIFDVKGRRVRTLVDEVLPAQVHEVAWTGRDDGGRQVAAGVYFYMVTSGDHHAVGRMALVK